MKKTKNNNWKKWLKRSLWAGLIILTVWIVNLIWFKPFNIEHLYNRAFIKVMLKSPELVTQLNIPVLYGFTNNKLTDVSDEATKNTQELLENEYKILRKYDFDDLSKENQLNTKILSWYLKNTIEGGSFLYQNYSFNHLFAEALAFPGFMQDYHKLKNTSDIKAYLERLQKFPTKLLQITKKDSVRASMGILPPDFIIKKTIGLLENLIGITEDSTKEVNEIKNNSLYVTLKNGLSKIEDISEKNKLNYLNNAEQIIEFNIIPAYKDYIKHLRNLLKTANSDAGVWKLPNGDAYYRYCLKKETTTTLDPETIYQIGLDEVARIQKEMRNVVEDYGVADSTIPMEEAMNIVAYKTGKVLYAPKIIEKNELSDQLLNFYRKTLVDADSMFSPLFNIKPKSKLIVQPTPEYLGSSAPNQYRYTDGKGIFYVNLTGINKRDSIYLFADKSLAYHEGIPGHHFQTAIQRELENVPMFRNVLPFTAYTEGWGLYAEYLAEEAGAYKNDPAGNLGRLWSELHRAVRLVVDNGIHYKRWSREAAIQYMVDNLYASRSGSEGEIDRYIVLPGQACAYKIGMMKILELRKKAQIQLGDNFNIREFHDVILKNGPLPLEILEEIVNNYIENKKLLVANKV